MSNRNPAMAVAAMLLALALASPVAASELSRRSALDGLAPLSATELSRATGRGGIDLEAVNGAIMRDNAVGANSITGSNAITNSLNGNSGIVTVFQNTGNNALFQSSTSVNINLR
jgi:hypothetical protein